MRKKRVSILLALLTLLVLCVSLTFGTASAATFEPEDVNLKTKAVALYNLDTDSPVFTLNADTKMYPASTTKIMTYIVVVENIKDLENTKITVKQSVLNSLLGTESSVAGILDGEELTVLQLLNMMMIPSGNDAAAVLCDYVGKGSEEKFVKMMNQTAKQLGCNSTHFANSHGLHDEKHYTTANDLYKMTKYAMTLPYFTEITSKTSYELPKTNVSDEPRTVITTNKMLMSSEPDYFYQYAQGIKTGTTDQAGYCLVSSAIYNGSSYICVALGAPSVDSKGNTIEKRRDMIDSANLYRWAFTKLALKTVAEKGSPVAELPLKYAWGKNNILLSPEEPLTTVLPSDVNPSSLMMETNLPYDVEAPIHTGDIVGTATYSYAGQKLGTVNLIATEDVSRNEVLVVLDVIWKIVSSPIFIIIASLVILLLIFYIIMAVRYNKKRKAMRKNKRYKPPRH